MRIALLIFMVAACNANGVPPGSECDVSSDCTAGVSCLELGELSGSACMLEIKQCSLTCGSDADCASLGTGFICFPSCNGSGSFMECTGAAGQPG
jgi:hypothetical protein